MLKTYQDAIREELKACFVPNGEREMEKLRDQYMSRVLVSDVAKACEVTINDVYEKFGMPTHSAPAYNAKLAWKCPDSMLIERVKEFPELFVGGLYLTHLKRWPDHGGYQYWNQMLEDFGRVKVKSMFMQAAKDNGELK
jgi:hypothetical protein